MKVTELKFTKFTAVLFGTLTYTGKRWSWDDVAIETRAYFVWLCRKLNAHLRVIIGIELGANSHVHFVIYSPDLKVTKRTLEIAKSQKAWPYGRVKDIQPYNQDMGNAGIIYTSRHEQIPMAGEVFHPHKGQCRKDNCCYPKRLDHLT